MLAEAFMLVQMREFERGIYLEALDTDTARGEAVAGMLTQMSSGDRSYYFEYQISEVRPATKKAENPYLNSCTPP